VEDLIHELVDAYNGGERNSMLAMVDEDAVAVVPDTMPNGGTYRGHAGIGAMLDSWEEAWDPFSVELGEVEDAGDAAIASVVQRGRGRASGVEVELALQWLVRERAGKLVYWRLCESVEEARRLSTTG